MNHARLSPEQRADDISWSYEDAELRSQDADRAHGPGCLDLMSLVCIQTLSRIQIIRSIKSNYKTSILKFALIQVQGPYSIDLEVFSILTSHNFV